MWDCCNPVLLYVHFICDLCLYLLRAHTSIVECALLTFVTPLLPKHVSPQLCFLYYMHITLSMIYNVRFGVRDRGLGGGEGGWRGGMQGFPHLEGKTGEAKKCMFLQGGGCFQTTSILCKKPLPNPPNTEFINVVSCYTHTDQRSITNNSYCFIIAVI